MQFVASLKLKIAWGSFALVRIPREMLFKPHQQRICVVYEGVPRSMRRRLCIIAVPLSGDLPATTLHRA